MKKLHVCFWASLAALLMLAAVPADAADVKELFAIDLPDSPGKEGRMIEVSYPPGVQDVVHRHDAHAFVYVLEGTIVGSVAKLPFGGKIRKWGIGKSMICELQLSCFR